MVYELYLNLKKSSRAQHSRKPPLVELACVIKCEVLPFSVLIPLVLGLRSSPATHYALTDLWVFASTECYRHFFSPHPVQMPLIQMEHPLWSLPDSFHLHTHPRIIKFSLPDIQQHFAHPSCPVHVTLYCDWLPPYCSGFPSWLSSSSF